MSVHYTSKNSSLHHSCFCAIFSFATVNSLVAATHLQLLMFFFSSTRVFIPNPEYFCWIFRNQDVTTCSSGIKTGKLWTLTFCSRVLTVSRAQEVNNGQPFFNGMKRYHCDDWLLLWHRKKCTRKWLVVVTDMKFWLQYVWFGQYSVPWMWFAKVKTEPGNCQGRFETYISDKNCFRQTAGARRSCVTLHQVEQLVTGWRPRNRNIVTRDHVNDCGFEIKMIHQAVGNRLPEA